MLLDAHPAPAKAVMRSCQVSRTRPISPPFVLPHTVLTFPPSPSPRPVNMLYHTAAVFCTLTISTCHSYPGALTPCRSICSLHETRVEDDFSMTIEHAALGGKVPSPLLSATSMLLVWQCQSTYPSFSAPYSSNSRYNGGRRVPAFHKDATVCKSSDSTPSV